MSTPQINIMANGDDEFTTAHVRKQLIAVRWRVGDEWWVAAPGRAPYTFGAEADAVSAFLGLAMEATR